MTKPKVLPMSAELRSMIAATAAYRKTRSVPVANVSWYHDGIVDTNETYRQKRLQLAANRWLGRSGFFQKPEVSDDCVVDANCIMPNGGLRPTWQGRA